MIVARSTMASKFVSPTPMVFGTGCLDGVGDHLPEGDCFLVMGSSGPRQKALMERIGGSVRGKLVPFTDVEPNPRTSTVARGAQALRGSECSFVMAVGGGSVIDAAKVMSIVATQGGTVMEYLKGARSPSGLGITFIAVPTTPGTSSEITPFAVVTSDEDRNKLGLRHPSMYPSLAVIDPSLTLTLPPDQTASSGFDILSHAFESYWSAKATPLTRDHALMAVRHLVRHLEKAFFEGSSIEAREGVSLASVHAGLSFSNTGTTICHAISYPVTYDTGLSHGKACALSLPATYRLVAERRRDIAGPLAEAFGCAYDELPERLAALMRRLGAPADLPSAGFEGGMDRIMGTEMGMFISNMPFPLSASDIRRVLLSIGGRVN